MKAEVGVTGESFSLTNSSFQVITLIALVLYTHK